MKKLYFLFFLLIFIFGLILISDFIKYKNNENYIYTTYIVNNGKDIMVKLPSGLGINTKLKEEDTIELISNSKSGLSFYAKEILEYYKWRNKNEKI